MASSKPIRKEIIYVGIDFDYNTYFNLTDLNDREITIINNFIKLKEKCIRENLEITPFSYENAHQKIEIKCLKHNYTWKTQIHHLTREVKQTGCKLCSKERASQSCKYTQEEIEDILKCKEKELNIIIPKFTYESIYQKINATCNNCNHEWSPSISSLKSGRGCPECAKEKRKINSRDFTLDEVIEKLNECAKELNFTLLETPKDSVKSTKIKYECNSCGYNGYKTIASILNKKGCPNCFKIIISKENRKNNRTKDTHLFKALTKEDVLKRLEECSEGKYTWEDFDYSSLNKTRLYCTCNICGYQWNTNIAELIKKKSKTGCPNCANIVKLTQDEAEERLKSLNKFTFEPFIYENMNTRITVICNKCGKSRESKYSNLFHRDCPHCAMNQYSKLEKEILDFCKEHTNFSIIENDRKTIKNPYTNSWLELDILIPDLNLAIEFNGSFWHSNKKIRKSSKGIFKRAKEKHILKTKLCRKKGIKLIHIYETHYLKDKNYYLEKIKNELVRGNSN